MKRGKRILAGSFMLLIALNQANAATITWTNTAGGIWTDAANWNPNQVPGASDDAIINAAGSYTVTVHGAGSVNSLVLGDALSSPVLRIEGNASYNGYLTLENSFTNTATLELVSSYPNRYAKLTVNGGPLVNDTAGIILVSDGGGSGTCTLESELDNRGTITVQYPLTIYKYAVLAHTNSGTINASADISVRIQNSTFDNTGSMTFAGGAGLKIDAGGAGPVFTTTGTLDLGAGNLEVDGGVFNLESVISCTGTQDYRDVTLNLTPDLSNAGCEIQLYNATVNGPGAVINAAGREMLLHYATYNTDVENLGDLVCWRKVSINGGFSSPAGSSIKVEGSGTYNAELILANSFTNVAIVELTSSHASRTATLTVTSGPLVNTASGTLLVSSGAGGGLRYLYAELDNRGTVTVNHDFNINKIGSTNINSGVITSIADITLVLSNSTFDNTGSMTFTGGELVIDSSGAFTTTGTLEMGARNLYVDGGVFNLESAISCTGTQDFRNVTLNLTPDLSNADAELHLYNATVNGPGKLINAAGREMLLTEVTCNADLENLGDLVCWRAVRINSGFDSPLGSSITVEGSGNYNASLLLEHSFTNAVTLELTSTHASRTATLQVWDGTLLNTASGTLLVSSGAGGGVRLLYAELDNRGTVTINHEVQINKSSVAHANSGVVTVSADIRLALSHSTFDNTGSISFTDGDLDIYNSGGAFTTSGTLDLGAGNLSVDACTFNLESAISCTGTQDFSNATLNLTPDLSNAGTELQFYNATVNGPGKLINAAGRDMLLNYVTCNADLENRGDLVFWRRSVINGGFTCPAGTSVKVEGNGNYNAELALAHTLTNSATLELTSDHASRTAKITAFSTSGPLVNTAEGTLLISSGAGGGARVFTAELDNRGTVTVNHELTVEYYEAQHLNSGTIALVGGNLSFTMSGTTPSFNNSGIIDIGETRTMTVDDDTFTNLVGGVIQGTGSLDLTGTTSGLVNHGSVAPGVSPGLLSLAGDYNSGAGGALVVEIGGPAAGSGYDQFAISGAANLDGTLEAALIGGFEPDQYDSFTVATFASRAGTFASSNLPSAHLYGWEVEYTNTSVKLTVINTAPEFDTVVDQEIDELTELTVDASATDTDTPVQTLTYSLLNEPSGAIIDPGSGLFSWTPTEAQGPGTNTITVRVVDDGTPNLSATNEFEVIVNEVNTAPAFDETPDDITVDELTLLTVPNPAGDADIPANTLTYSLLTPPVGAEIDPASGVITWMPAEDQGPGTNTIISVVTDDGDPVLSATNSFQVFVEEVNTAPELDAVADATSHAEALFAVTLTASDDDIPANTLSFSLVSGPVGAQVNPSSGLFSWTPGAGDAGSSYPVMVKVEDSGSPVLSDTQLFSLTVVDPLAFTSIQTYPTGSVEVTWIAISGQTYRVWYTDDLADGVWSNLVPDVTAAGPFASQLDAAASNAVNRFYDVFQVE